jgi:hypothetical protein
MVTFGIITSPGTKYVDRLPVPLSRIYVPPMSDNPVRKKGKDLRNIQKLTKSLMNGINYSKMPPVIRKNPRIVDGVHYDYELVCGNHRYEALVACGYDQWIFDIYEFALNGISYEDSVRTFQLQENDHEPQLESSIDDVVNVISRLIDYGSKLVNNTESSISNYVTDYCPNMHWQTQSKVVRAVVAACGAYQDVVTYTPDDVQRWVNKNTTLTIKGNYDKYRDMCGWSCLTGYEYEVMFNMIKKYSELGKESYIICHTKAPSKDRTLEERRNDIVDKFDSLNESLVEVIKFYNKNKRFPWQIEGFLPQDRKKPENANELVILE